MTVWRREQPVIEFSKEVVKDPGSFDLLLKLRYKAGVLKITAKSVLFENFFKEGANEYSERSGERTTWDDGSGVQGLKLWTMMQKPQINCAPVEWNKVYALPLQNSVINMSWLRVVGLGEGITITYHTPWTKEMEEKYLNGAQLVLEEFHQQYIQEREAIVKATWTIQKE